jgi:hypothetical protein
MHFIRVKFTEVGSYSAVMRILLFLGKTEILWKKSMMMQFTLKRCRKIINTHKYYINAHT